MRVGSVKPINQQCSLKVLIPRSTDCKKAPIQEEKKTKTNKKVQILANFKTLFIKRAQKRKALL